MVQSNEGTEFDVGAIIEAVKADTHEGTPSNRAMKVLKALKESHPDLTSWDLVCFAAEFIASMAATSTPWLREIAINLIRVVYLAHYTKSEDAACMDRSLKEQEGA